MAFGSYTRGGYMDDVACAFLNGETMQKNSMSCSSSALYSYGAKIAFWEKGEVVVNNCSYSQTTSSHQTAILNAVRSDVAMVNDGYLHKDTMIYQPKRHKHQEISYYYIENYVSAAKLLKDRSHTAYAKKLDAMTPEDVSAHNKEVRARHKEERRVRDIKYFLDLTTIKRNPLKKGEKGSIGKILGRKFSIMGLESNGDLMLLLAAHARGFKVGDNLSINKASEQYTWTDGVMRVTSVSKLGVKFNDQFITNKQINAMIRRGDVRC